MLKKSLLSGLGFSTIALAAMIFLGSCTSKITEEQLKQLRDLRTQERGLSESIQQKKDEKSRLERELNARKAELKKCSDEKKFVQEKLAKWPDVWPDYPEGK